MKRAPLRSIALSTLLALACLTSSSPAADWPTHRGNPQRTGSVDNKPGPTAPKILWVYESSEHFIASPVLGPNELLISGLGAFNTAALHALSLDPALPADKRELWAKKPPYLKQPVACPPAIASNRIIFGDGMHQTDGATLHCLGPAGQPLWQFPVPGALVHLEGGPTITGSRVYIGGGNAGVIAIDFSTLTLNGKTMPIEEAQKQIEAQWKEMMDKYEVDKKKDPDFAIPPSEDALPKPQPKKLWQIGNTEGKGQWHVDAAVAVVNGTVLAASAYLDQEKLGDRALHAIDANTGIEKWRTPLDHNPWGGPTVVGDTIVIGCSSIRFDPKEIPGAKGEIVALSLADGKVLWKTPIPGGVVSPVTAVGDMAYCTATDGKLHALSLKDGKEKWAYTGGAPFFAGPAAAGNTLYAGDLKGVVHAIDMASGRGVWTVDLATDPATKALGMIYGSPVLADGKLYIATCNLEAPQGQTKTVVVCIGQK
jgi:outer membrane protein assembly factor BamB